MIAQAVTMHVAGTNVHHMYAKKPTASSAATATASVAGGGGGGGGGVLPASELPAECGPCCVENATLGGVRVQKFRKLLASAPKEIQISTVGNSLGSYS